MTNKRHSKFYDCGLILGICSVLLMTTPPVRSQKPTSMFDEAGDFRTAFYVDGNELLTTCENEPDKATVFVMGAHDAFIVSWKSRAQNRFSDTQLNLRECLNLMPSNLTVECFLPPVCVPLGVKANQMKDVVCKWLRENPERRHLAASDLLREALTSVWPCSERPEFDDAMAKHIATMVAETEKMQERLPSAEK